MDNEETIDNLKGFYHNFAKNISKLVRSCDTKESRLIVLKNANPTNPTLLKVYEIAKENEDFETCEVANQLLLERGINIISK